MRNLFNRTEFSFRLAYGPLEKVLKANDKTAAGICDRGGTWGHVAFNKACKKANVKPIFGVELALVPDPALMEKQGSKFVRIIALNNDGLRELYQLTSRATAQFYYYPRIGEADLGLLSENCVIASADMIDYPAECRALRYLDLNPTTSPAMIQWAAERGIPPICSSDNFFPSPGDREVYEIAVGGRNSDDKTSPMHILSASEWRVFSPGDSALKDLALQNAAEIAARADVILPKAENVRPKVEKTLMAMCEEGAASRGISLDDPVYRARLDREISLIIEKDFQDYFFLIADLVTAMKKNMLVGPARGSSCGSLACYLLGITEVDPIPYGLLFERFIDINRKDLPDIDIDFPDNKRDQVIIYLREKYGEDCVAQLGTVSRFKAKATINDVAREFNIPSWDVAAIKEQIIERDDGDARASLCIADTFATMDIGKRLLEKYPHMKVAQYIEGHARHTGVHAAGIVVTSNPVYHYCAVDKHTGAAMVDKYDAEILNLLKIDALGLRTLSVIEDCLAQIGWTNEDLLAQKFDDDAAFNVLNDGKFSGIFQFEGNALQSLCRMMKVQNFEDVVSLTALARPGPLMSGLAHTWIARRTGREKIVYEHPELRRILKTTFGVMIYQENIMHIIREIGRMSWEDVSAIRKLISKSVGAESFEKYKEGYLKGCAESEFVGDLALKYWDDMISFGSYAFNRSHAVAYAMVSYWCMLLKAKFPLEYAASCLRNAKDDEQSIALLRELRNEGFQYKAFDAEKSRENWSVQDGVLIGGLLGVKGIAAKTSADIIRRRAEGLPLTERQKSLLEKPSTPYDMVFEAQERFSHIFANPADHGIVSHLSFLGDITDQSEGEFCFIAKVTEFKQKNANDPENVKRRGGRLINGNVHYLNLKLVDDTGEIGATIGRDDFERYGLKLLEKHKKGDWFVFKGRCSKGFRWVHIQRWKHLA